ncbi:MAG: acyltransferase family protein [Desulfovibrio sp.]|jgi:surface polysaccharide O-acyltransferase-like enzyme|nr:acyltransferase family protein [Desulfovibrio sp.]
MPGAGEVLHDGFDHGGRVKSAAASKRVAYLDALKAVAIYFVVVIHVVGFKVASFDNGVSWFVAHFFSMMARFAVPVFVMCSGAVLLGRAAETGEDVLWFYKRYLVRYVGYLFLGLLVSKALSLYLGIDVLSLKGIVYEFNAGFGAGMWFFFMLMGLVLVAPLLQCIVRNRFLTKLFLALWFVFCIVNPLFSGTLGLYRVYIENALYGSFFVGYFVLGYFLATMDRQLSARALASCAFLGLMLATVAGYAMSLWHGKLHEYFYYSNNPFVFVYTVSMFLLFKNVFAGKEAGGVLRTLSSVSGYIYVFHISVISLVPIGYSQNILVLFFIRVPAIVFISVVISLLYMRFLPLIERFVLLPVQRMVQVAVGRLYGKLESAVQPYWMAFKAWMFC